MSDPKGGREPGSSADPPRPTRGRERASESRWLDEVRRRPLHDTDRRGDRAATDRPRVALCDEGELDDVHRLLCELDQRPLRLRPGDLADLREWERPSRLLIATVRVALRDVLPLPDPSAGGVAIAVTESDAASACAAMLRRGFRYVVRRPVHPEALRLLLMQVLWRGRESRLVARFPFGAEIAWRSGLRRGRATMVEISAHGCRLLCRDAFRPGERVRLRVPAALTGSRDLRLRGRIVRRDRPSGTSGAPQVAVQFEGLSARSFAHLDALLAERASGPAVMGGAQREVGSRGAPEPPGRSAQARHPRPRSPGAPRVPDAPDSASRPPRDAVPEVERRRRPRGVWQREVVALARDGDRVLHTLLGSDLSVGGVRVEPHPLLRLGDRLRLALYEAARVEPLVLEARVAHEEGRRGVGLVFVDVSDDAQERLARMVADLPPLSSLAEGAEKPHAVVMGEIMVLEPDETGSAARGDQDQAEREHDHGASDHHDDEA